MTKSEIMKMAHSEARKLVSQKGYAYSLAMVYGLRRAHNAAEKAVFVAAQLAQPEAPKFLWLRGL